MLGRLLGRPESFLLRNLRGTEWSQLADYVSPSFFEVLPARALLAQVRELAGNATAGTRFQVAQRTAEAEMGALGRSVRIGGEPPTGLLTLGELGAAERRERGQAILELYFAQLRGGPASLLDLRGETFRGGGDALHWSPRPIWLVWERSFLDGVRDLYGGFYEDDDARFRRALSALEIDVAEDLFREHFGGDDQRAVHFDTATFHATFHEVFVRCRDAGVRLHRNFLALGIYLGCLYDHLEALDLSFDVREAYHRSALTEKTR